MGYLAAWSAVSGFFRSPLGKYVAIAMAVLGLLGAVWWSGDHHGHSAEKAAQARAVAAARVKVAKTDAKIAAAVEPIRQKAAAERVRIETVTRYLTKEVPVYVTKEADARCVISDGFVRLWNASPSADGAEVPAAPSGSVDADSGVALSDVSAAAVANHGAFEALRSEVKAWREYYPTVKKLYEEAVPPTGAQP